MQRSKRARVLNALRIKRFPQADWDHSLPVELLEDIFALAMEDFTKSSTPMTDRRKSVQPLLRSLAAVCRVWYLMVTPMLYREIYISSSNALACLARAVTKYPHLQPLVDSFQFSSIMFRSGRVEISETDVWNIKRIYRACTNLNSHTVERPLGDFPPYDEEILKTIGLDAAAVEKLTRLEIRLPDVMPCYTNLLFSSEFVLPALQELVVEDLDKSPYDLDHQMLKERRITWPQMPQLSKLCIKNWNVRRGCFRFPEGTKLRVIELLGGDYKLATGFFYPELDRHANTLESLTITAIDLDEVHSFIVDLREYAALTELCVPLKAFGTWDWCVLPHNLQRFVLAGCPERKYDESDVILLGKVEKKLGDLLETRNRGGRLKNLKLVRIMVKSVWMWSLGPAVKFRKAVQAARDGNVRLTFGFLWGEENTLTENLKEKMYDKFPLLERKLQ